MRRKIGVAALVVVLLATVVVSEVRLRAIGRADPLGRELLYLPSPEMLELVSLGNRGLMADLLFLWSIQYYSQFRLKDKFLYVANVYDLITDLDPLFFDAYRVGAMIMTIEKAGDPKKRRDAVEALYDKGLENMPDSWELAEVAAWDAYNHLLDRELAIRYAGIGARRPGAPARLARVFGRWQEKLGAWTISDSIAYWEDVLADAVRKPDVILAKSHLYDAYAKLHRQQLDPLLQRWRSERGACPTGWQPLVDAGWLAEVPLDAIQKPYGIYPESCTLHPRKRIRWD
jgi:hypothetical protein